MIDHIWKLFFIQDTKKFTRTTACISCCSPWTGCSRFLFLSLWQNTHDTDPSCLITRYNAVNVSSVHHWRFVIVVSIKGALRKPVCCAFISSLCVLFDWQKFSPRSVSAGWLRCCIWAKNRGWRKVTCTASFQRIAQKYWERNYRGRLFLFLSDYLKNGLWRLVWCNMSMNNSIKSCLSKVSCMWAQMCLTVRKTLRLRQQLQLCSVSRFILWYCDMRDDNHHLLSDSVRLNIWFAESLLICVKAASHMLNQNFTAPPCLYFDVCQQSFPNVSVGKCFILKSVHLKCPACCLAHCSAHKTNPCLT